MERQRLADANRPHVVLGIRPSEDAKWLNCDLAKTLVNEEELATSAELQPATYADGVLSLPKHLNFGVGEDEKKMLFEHLPPLSAEADALRDHNSSRQSTSWTASRYAEAEKRELDKAATFATVLDLRNASAGGIAYENRRRIIAEFSGPDNSFDTGRPEVQGK